MCRAAIITFCVAWYAALGLLLIGTFGWFGQENDPLSGVFLIPLGLPWNQPLGHFPEGVTAWGAAVAPAANLLVLSLICRRFARLS